MMKVFLVDDELLIRTKLKYMIEVEIPQMKPNMEVVLCGEASNGVEALGKIEKLKPDVIISDMKMPEMDGLALCRTCRERYPGCAFLVLSNYDDFAYVKETLLLGAGDYLLKHSLDAAALLQALRKVYTEGNIRERERSSAGISSLKEDIFHGLLGGLYLNERQIEADIRTFDLPISVHRAVPVMMWIQEYEDGEFKKNNTLSFSVKNIVNEILEDQNNGIFCHADREKYVLLLTYDGIASEQKIRELLLFTLGRIRFCMDSFLGLTVHFIVGRIQASALTAGEEYHLLETQFQSSFYQEKDIWLSETAGNQGDKPEKTLFSDEDEKNLIYELSSGSPDTAKAFLDILLKRITQSRPSETIYRMILANILTCIKKAARSSAVKEDELFFNGFSEETILNMKSVRRVQESLNQICDRFFEEKNNAAGNAAVSSYMQKAAGYIHQHFRENISQTDVAEHVGISPVYLSVLFKNEMKDTFPSYLRTVRLKEAEHLLARGKTNLREVAENSGFQDYTYFLKCFKKQYGYTPKEFLKMHNMM